MNKNDSRIFSSYLDALLKPVGRGSISASMIVSPSVWDLFSEPKLLMQSNLILEMYSEIFAMYLQHDALTKDTPTKRRKKVSLAYVCSRCYALHIPLSMAMIHCTNDIPPLT